MMTAVRQLQDESAVILSRHRRFIFFKTIKTGGTSCEIALSRFCGPQDVITYLPPPDEQLRRSQGGRGEQNNHNPLYKQWGGRILGWDREKRKHRFGHNISAVELRSRIPDWEWENYHKVTIARNPFDRAISKYFHDRHHTKDRDNSRRPDPSKDDINDYLLTLPDRDLTNWHIYAEGSTALVDHVMRYENLPDEMSNLLRSIGVTADVELPHAKGGWRTNREPYQSIIGSELRRKIENIALNEMELMCYRW